MMVSKVRQYLQSLQTTIGFIRPASLDHLAHHHLYSIQDLLNHPYLHAHLGLMKVPVLKTVLSPAELVRPYRLELLHSQVLVTLRVIDVHRLNTQVSYCLPV